MIDPQVVAFAIAAGVLTIAPGQDTMLVVRNVLRGGRADGAITTFGICSGLFLHATLSAVGVSAILLQSAIAFQVVKLAGAAYLAWLGVRSLWSAWRGPELASLRGCEAQPRPALARRCFVEGFLSNVLNPKTAVFYLALLPQFIGSQDAVLERSLLLAMIHFTESVVWLVGVALAVDRMRPLLGGSAFRRWLDGLCGIVLVGFGARLALERR